MKIYIYKFKNNYNRSKKHNILINNINDSIVYNTNGKPFTSNKNIKFNISYSGNIGVLAISDKDVGIDIENIKDIDDRVLNKVYSKDEINFINNSENKYYEYTKLWTKKESYVKYIGIGITEDFFNLSYDESLFKTFNYKNYIITICSKDLEIESLELLEV